ncbi:MAG: flavocytochrome c [Dehalococcoidia bacterium]|nr:MAG: flavocytochrome c [Dehalococcoidia bacterium]
MTMTTSRPEAAGLDGFQPDIIAVGAGTAGLILAYSAAEAGARVLLLEKTDRIGGTLYISSGMFSAGGTKRQRERGIEDSPDEHFADIIRISRDTVNRELVRRYVDIAPALVDWLQDNGFEFEESCPVIIYGHEPYSKPRTYWGAENGRSLLKLFKRLLEPYFASGQVRVVLNAPAEQLVMEDDRVVGVVAGGREYRAPAVVLTTGGYANSPELFARFTGGRRLVSIGNLASTGDGIVLGEQVGAQIVGSQYFLPTFGGIEDPDQPGRVYASGPDEWDINARLVPQTRLPWEIWVNQHGERFIREDEESVDNRERVLLQQPDMRFWVVFDDRILDESPPLILRWPAEELRAKAKEGRFVLAAETLADLAAKMDVPAAALERTVNAYNAALERGAPDPLGRAHRPLPIVQPPFYAIKQQGIVLRTWTGLRADRELRIVRPDGTPIAGLYGAGEVLGAATFSGDSFCGGMSIGPALAFGRELGKRLAQQLVGVG